MEFLKKKIPVWIPIIILLAFIIGYLAFSAYVRGVEDTGTTKLMAAISEGHHILIDRYEKSQAALTTEIEVKNGVIEGQKKEIEEKRKEITKLKGELKRYTRQPPFHDLKNCQEEYNRLFDDYERCLILTAKQDESLVLYQDTLKDFDERFKLQEHRYKDCRNEVQVLTTEITGYKTVNIQLEKEVKKTKRSGLLNIGKGVVIGVLIKSAAKVIKNIFK